MQPSRYVIEVKNNITNTLKTVFLDRSNVFSENAMGVAALQAFKLFPATLSEDEKDFVLKSLKNAPYREMEDGRKILPEIITRFGSMNMENKSVDFTVEVYKVGSTGSVSGISVSYETGFNISGVEGKGKHNRDETNYAFIPRYIMPVGGLVSA